MANIGQRVSNAIGFDPTFGFNLSKSAGGQAGKYGLTATGTTNLFNMGGDQVANDGYNGPWGATKPVQNDLDLSKVVRTGAYTEPGGGTQEARDLANTLFGIDSGISQAQDGLGRLDRQEQIGYGNIDREYQGELGQLQGNRTRNADRFNRQKTDQTNEYLQNRNQVADQSRSWLQGAQGQLGANGAGGGSTARYRLPFEAQNMAAKGNATAQATNARNISGLTESYNEDKAQFSNAEQDLQRQREQGRNDFASRIMNQRVDFNNTLGSLQGQKAIAQGGNWQAAQNAANPYTSKIAAMLDQIDGLSATPAVKARQVVTGRPDLSGYNWARPGAEPVAQQDASLGQQDPLLALFGLQDEQRRI